LARDEKGQVERQAAGAGSANWGGLRTTDLDLEGLRGQPWPPLTLELAMPGTAVTARRLVPIAETAEILGISAKTVRRRIASGDLSAVRLGRRTIRLKTESIDPMFDSHSIDIWRGTDQ
jgi:excisionase family DNA binding protein